jgi:hypothetical protein
MKDVKAGSTMKLMRGVLNPPAAGGLRPPGGFAAPPLVATACVLHVLHAASWFI